MPAGEDASTGLVDRLDLENALDRVTPEYRQVLVLRHVADLDYADIAETLGLPIGTVRSRLARGRHQLMEHLGNPGDTSDRQNSALNDGIDTEEGHEHGK